MDLQIKNFLSQVNRASDGRLAVDYPDPYAEFDFVGGPTPEHPEAGYLVVHRPCETVEQWRARFNSSNGK